MNRNQLSGTTVLLGALSLTFLGPLSASAEDLEISTGKIHTYAAGIVRAYDIQGDAMMLKTPGGNTVVEVAARGLQPDTSYAVHVHNKPCNVEDGGGHYQDVVGGPVDNVNEIWPGFITNAAGIGEGSAFNNFYARPEAQSVVIHDTDKARIACADLKVRRPKLHHH